MIDPSRYTRVSKTGIYAVGTLNVARYNEAMEPTTLFEVCILQNIGACATLDTLDYYQDQLYRPDLTAAEVESELQKLIDGGCIVLEFGETGIDPWDTLYEVTETGKEKYARYW